MTTNQPTTERLASDLEANGPSSTAAIADRLGLTVLQVQRGVSNFNRTSAPDRKIVQSVSAKGKTPGLYHLVKSGESAPAQVNAPAKLMIAPISDDGDIVDAEFDPMEQASEQLAQCLVGAMRIEVDAMLNAIVRQAVTESVGGMLQGIRSALAKAFGQPAVDVNVAQAAVIQPDEIAIPEKQAAQIFFKCMENAQATKEKIALEVLTSPAPAVTNVMSTRTKHREKTKPVAVAAQETAPAYDRKPKVIIAGLHSNKQEFIRREFRDCFDLRIYTPDQLRATQDGTCAGDVAFLMADFVSHKHQDALEAAGAKITVVHGGISSLREAMTSHYVEKAAA